jgi:PleD family two-component response regulator
MRLPHPRSDAAESVSLSAGVAELHGAGRDAIEDWLRRSQQALDAARATGGNAIVRGGNTRVAGHEDRS